jgi:phage terminase large subunit-like protein
MGRKNGKTALIACLCLAHLCGPEAIKNGQLYSLSVDREQAGILFNYARDMVYMDEELSSRLNVIESRKQIIDPLSGSRYLVLSGEKKGKMGKSSSAIFLDELAEFGSDRSLYDALVTSTGAHAEPLIWVFSTQAPDDRAVLSELIDHGKKIQSGEIADDSFKLFLYEIREPTEEEAKRGYDPVWDESEWTKANPALGDFRSLEEMRNFSEKAKRMPSAETSYRNLYCNQRIDGAAHFITPEVWKGCGNGVCIETFETAEVFGGLDLSSKNDLCCLALVA